MNIKENADLIAPCGMNCSLCSGYQALKHNMKKKGIGLSYCAGCRPRDKQCGFLKKRCDTLKNKEIEFCFSCTIFPCEHVKGIDKRYRTYYHTSLIENLQYIKEHGLENFIRKEKEIWACPICGSLRCCHNGLCYHCDVDTLKNKKNFYRWEDE